MDKGHVKWSGCLENFLSSPYSTISLQKDTNLMPSQAEDIGNGYASGEIKPILSREGGGGDYIAASEEAQEISEVETRKEGKVEVVTINCGVEKLDGFSGHSDYNQLMSFVQRLRPKLRRVLVNHGERKKSENLAMNIRRMYRVPAHYPQVQEAIKLF